MNYKLMVLIVSTIHILWGLIILTYGSIPHTTTLTPMSHLFRFPFGALTLIISSALALYSLRVENKNLSVILVLPQQALLVLSTYGTIIAMLTSSFADGVVRPWQFIFVDQIIWLTLFVFYTLSLFKFHNVKYL